MHYDLARARWIFFDGRILYGRRASGQRHKAKRADGVEAAAGTVALRGVKFSIRGSQPPYKPPTEAAPLPGI